MKAKAKYNDIPFFLLFIAFASAFTYYLTYQNIEFNRFLFLTYVLDTIQGWAAWLAVRSIILYLDRKMPYEDNVAKRIAVQIATTTFTGLLIISILTEITWWILRGQTAGIDFYTFDVFIIIIWFFVINGIYIGMHFFHEWNQSETKRLQDKKLKATGYYVKTGKQDLLIPFEDILGFYSDDGFSYLHTTAGRTYLSDGSLDKIEGLIPGELFYRLNRKYILHRNAIKGFKRVGDGKLEVGANAFGNIPETIPVSRLRAVPFKKWFTSVET